MFKNRSMHVRFVKDGTSDSELPIPAFDPEKIEEIARRSVLDMAKLVVVSVAALMVLHTTLEIVEDKATHND